MKHVIEFIEYCKVLIDEVMRMRGNCKSLLTTICVTKIKVFYFIFTAGFMRGFLSTVRNYHYKETQCIVAGDPYCEWEFR